MRREILICYRVLAMFRDICLNKTFLKNVSYVCQLNQDSLETSKLTTFC